MSYGRPIALYILCFRFCPWPSCLCGNEKVGMAVFDGELSERAPSFPFLVALVNSA